MSSATTERAGAVTFKGNPLTLIGPEVKAGDQAPAFHLKSYANGAMETITNDTVKGKPTFLSVVPSLDTPVCQAQTKSFNESLNAYGDKINAVTVSLDLPFAMNRFCGAENIKIMQNGSDYMDREFGKNYGTLIKELMILSRAIFVIDANGKVAYAEYVKEVADPVNFDAALAALKPLVK